jgi:hypothetical protein
VKEKIEESFKDKVNEVEAIRREYGSLIIS